eukprot:TRINITY_DN11405_c0_g1_i2.p2 TRINITY_DN11405_c0_g1~~TRINITY_DN11405_c0_g1_i2.p2  ORF type:complete len:108 (+),score=28.08 TRINITY_DN11405_c0_g1_i2:282-605(+)
MNFIKAVAAAIGESDAFSWGQIEVDEAVNKLFVDLDTDGDGLISFDEVLECAESNGADTMLAGLDEVDPDEWAMGMGMLDFMTDSLTGGDFSAVPMLEEVVGRSIWG